MKQTIDALTNDFKEGRRAEAIAAGEALCRQDPPDPGAQHMCASMHALNGNHVRALELLHLVRTPGKEDPEILINIALCERELRQFESAEQFFRIYTETFPGHAVGWAGRTECKLQLREFDAGLQLAERALQLDPGAAAAWTAQGHCHKGLGQFDQALASYRKSNQIQPSGECWLSAGQICSQQDKPAEAVEAFTQALKLVPSLSAARVARGDAFQALGTLNEAAADYQAALAQVPSDSETLKKATLCLLELGQGEQALDLCRKVLRTDPDNLTAKLGAEWVLGKLVPIWHVPMMNEHERNQAYHDGLQAVVAPEKMVFEIGTGSGLLAMMAARLGARQVVTCEAVALVARAATRIVQRNGLQDQVKVLSKPSYAVRVPEDMPAQADVLVHEIFSSELLGEHVLPAIEDARARLLKPGGVIMPGVASIMIALVGGEDVARNVRAQESFGFDLRDFNAIYPRKWPLHREDLKLELMSDTAEAFRFDFRHSASFPAERRRIAFTASRAGVCYGVIQWLRIEMVEGVIFENHPLQQRMVANWQNTIYGFDEPLELQIGKPVAVNAIHDRARPWFDLADRPRAAPPV